MISERTRIVVAACAWLGVCGCFPDIDYAAETLDAADAQDANGDTTTDHADTTVDQAVDFTTDPVADAAIDQIPDLTTDQTADVEASVPPVEDMVLITPGTASFQLTARRAFGETQPPVNLTLTRAFYMDRYEVTTGRFKTWVDKGRPLPCDGCSLDEDGPYASEMIWRAAWTQAYEPLLVHAYDDCYSPLATPPSAPWSLSASTDTWTYPMTCVTWFDAVAFCHSEGKRLPTHAEWVYAARGGPTPRTYPWGETSAADCSSATFNLDGATPPYCGFPVPVGSAANDESPLGIRDLGGSVFEWVWDVDWMHATLPSNLTDYVGPEDQGTVGTPTAWAERIRKGGAYVVPLEPGDPRMANDVFDSYPPFDYYADAGLRCVRSVTQ